MDVSTKTLSDVVTYSKYAKYNETLGRRETFDEIVDRNLKMHINKFKGNTEVISELNRVFRDFVRTKKVLPSMRGMQFAGKPIEISPNRLYNCCAVSIDSLEAFPEVMFLLLGGTGVGFSVQAHHVDKLPTIKKSSKTRRYLIGDSIEGWADAVKILMRSFFEGKPRPKFDFSDIREKGAPLITSGGKAPGAQPLHDCLHRMTALLNTKEEGSKLKPIEVHDLMCYIADAVLAGGIRRAAMISLFDLHDEDMLTCKFGNWWELNPQRGRANNSAVIIRDEITENEFRDLVKKIELSGCGEPGFYFSNDRDYLTNPCAEISLKSCGFCNLTEVNISDVVSQDDLNERVAAASFLGTIQASYTDFHYLRDIWKKNAEEEALIGVSTTGVASGAYKTLSLSEAAEKVVETNIKTAKLIGINPARRTTCVKPAGTTSLLLGCSSGIHAYHSPYYIRRMRVGKNETLYQYLAKNCPNMIVNDILVPNMGILEVPIKAPNNAITRSEPAIDLLERVKKFASEWITYGHISGPNTHNVSATITIKDHEWDEVTNWMWENRAFYNGLSILPYFGGSYAQTPFEEITEEEYNRLVLNVSHIDLSQVVEERDNTNLTGEIACGGGGCEL